MLSTHRTIIKFETWATFSHFGHLYFIVHQNVSKILIIILVNCFWSHTQSRMVGVFEKLSKFLCLIRHSVQSLQCRHTMINQHACAYSGGCCIFFCYSRDVTKKKGFCLIDESWKKEHFHLWNVLMLITQNYFR